MYKITIKDQEHYIENKENAKLIAINYVISCLNDKKTNHSVDLFNLIQNRKYDSAISLFMRENAGRENFSFTEVTLHYMKTGTLTYFNKLNKENIFK